MLLRVIAAAIAFAALLTACDPNNKTTLEDMQRNQRMATMRAA
jgi:hypothetical protein